MSLGASNATKKGPSLADSIIQKVQAQIAGTKSKGTAKAQGKAKSEKNCDCAAMKAHKGESGFDGKCGKAPPKKAVEGGARPEKGATAGVEKTGVKDNKASPQKQEVGKK